MRLPVFSHSANPAVDPPIIHKSPSYCAEQVTRGLAFWLPNKLGIQAFPPILNPELTEDELLLSSGDHGALSARECSLNAVGLADRGKRRLLTVERRAIAKVAAYA